MKGLNLILPRAYKPDPMETQIALIARQLMTSLGLTYCKEAMRGELTFP